MSLLKSDKFYVVIILTLLFVIVCSLPFISIIKQWDLTLYDKQSNFIRDFNGVEALKNEVVLIGIDEQTYGQIKEPFALWHKNFAELLTALSFAEASAVALDITLPSRSFNHIIPGIDQTLLKAMMQLKRKAPIVLGTTIDVNKQSREVYGPYLSVAGKNGGQAFVLWSQDEDRVVRYFSNNLGSEENPISPIVKVMADHLGHKSKDGFIDYTQGPKIKYIPLQQVLSWYKNNDLKQLKARFANKPVIVGAVLPFEDRHYQPVNLAAWEESNNNYVPGVLLHVQGLRNVLNGGFIQQTPFYSLILLNLFILSFWFLGKNIYISVLLALTSSFALLSFQYFLLVNHSYFPVASSLSALLIVILSRQLYEAVMNVFVLRFTQWNNKKLEIMVDKKTVRIRSLLKSLEEHNRTLEQTVKERTKDLRDTLGKLEVKNQFIRKTFGRYMSDEVVEKILETPDGLELGGTTLQTTVVFTDLRGFSAISETLAPESVVDMLNMYLHEMTKIISKYSGTINEFMGDGILLLFGAPIMRPDDAERAIACTLEMQLAMIRVNEKNREHGFPELSMGVGIHTGPIVAGNIGSDIRTKYAVVGSNVNLAARVESYTIGGQILITKSTLDAIYSEVIIADQFSAPFKGIKEPVTMYDISGIKGSYNLHLADKALNFIMLTSPQSIQLEEVKGKTSEGIFQHGTITALAGSFALLVISMKLEIRANVKFFLEAHSESESAIYAKIMKQRDDGSYEINLTYVPKEILIILENLKNNVALS